MSEGAANAGILSVALKQWRAAQGMPTLEESAEKAGVGVSTLHRAMSGGDVRLSTVIRLLQGVGGDFSRSLPPELRPPEAAAAPDSNGSAPSEDVALLAGAVRCGEVRWTPEGERPRLDLRPLSVASPERWRLGEGPGLGLRTLDGASGWPEGSLLLARKWKEGAEPPVGAEFTAVCQRSGDPAWRVLKVSWAPETRRYIIREGAAVSTVPVAELTLGFIVAGAVVPA